MKSLVAALLLLPCPALLTAGESPAPATATKTGKPAPKKPVLEKGMEAAAILQSYGKPVEIIPLESPDPATKAERWIYRRKVGQSTTQEHALDKSEVHHFTVGRSDGSAVVQTTVINLPEFKIKHTTTYQITALLMINGRLEVARQWKQQEENH